MKYKTTMIRSQTRAGANREARSRLRPRLVAWALICLSLGIGSIARATDDAERAEQLFIHGQQLMRAGDLHEACALLEESHRRDAALGTLLNLALCHQRQGRTASAFREYVAAAVWADRRGTADAERGRYAREQSGMLARSLSLLRIEVRSPPADLTVRLDGEVVDAAELAVAFPVDPGRHRLEVSARGKRPWRQDDVHITAPGTTIIHVFLYDVPRESGLRVPRRWALGAVAAGAGVLSAGAGLLVRAWWLGEESQRTARRASLRVPIDPTLKARALDRHGDAVSHQRAGLVLTGLGALGLAAGLYASLRASATERAEPLTAWHLAPAFCERGAGIGLSLGIP